MTPGPLSRANLNPIIVSALDFYRRGISAAVLFPRHLILSDSSATFCGPVCFCLLGITLYHQILARRYCLSPFSSSFMSVLNCPGSQDRLLTIISFHSKNCPVICIFYILLITSYSFRRENLLFLHSAWLPFMHLLSSKNCICKIQVSCAKVTSALL